MRRRDDASGVGRGIGGKRVPSAVYSTIEDLDWCFAACQRSSILMALSLT